MTGHPPDSPSADDGLPHPAVELLKRYRAVLGAAWSMRHELAGPRRLADEAAFLPAALALQELPVHPAPRRAMWAIMAIFAFALGWSLVGTVDVVATAPGRIVVSDGTKVVQPLEAGIVKAIRVKDGDRVRAGQVLIELDPTTATADREGLRAQTKTTGDEARRAGLLLRALDSPGIGGPPPGADAQGQAEWSDIAARLKRLDAEAGRRQAEMSTARELLVKLQTTLPLARQREADVTALAAQGFMAAHAGQDRTRERIELERDLATQKARLEESDAALAESRHARASYLAETRRSLNDRLTKATAEIEQLQQQATKAMQRERITSLQAPVTGTVQQLAIHSTGGVVTPAQALLVVVPDAAELTAEVVLDNKDIGFVKVGQDVAVKLDAFPFTRYGTVSATVTRVSSDAVSDEKRGAVFPASVQLRKPTIDVDGAAVRLSPGLSLVAEVRTGDRRVIDYLASPLVKGVSESLRER